MDIFISEILSPDRAIVISETLPVPVNFPSLIYGDSFTVNLYIVDGQDGFSDVSGSLNFDVKVGIGQRGTATAWLNTVWTREANGWSGLLTVNNALLLTLFDGQTSIAAIFEVQVNPTSGGVRTYASVPFELLAPAISTTAQDDPDEPASAARTLPLATGSGVTVDGNLVTVTGMAFGAIPTSIIVSINIPSVDAAMFSATVITTSITADGFEFVMGGIPDAGSYTFTFIPLFA